MRDAGNKKRLPGPGLRGESHGNRKLTDDNVRDMRVRYERGETQPSIGKMYGVSQATVSKIVLRQSWTHVE
jgi:hypothetical protein